MSLVDKARSLRAIIESLSVNLDDNAAIEAVELFPTWHEDTEYVTGDRLRYMGVLYKVLQNHTSQESWTPESTPSLYARVLIPDENVILVWEQPDSTNAYMTGDKVYFPTAEDDIYESLIDNNVWSPVDYPAGWSKISE